MSVLDMIVCAWQGRYRYFWQVWFNHPSIVQALDVLANIIWGNKTMLAVVAPCMDMQAAYGVWDISITLSSLEKLKQNRADHPPRGNEERKVIGNRFCHKHILSNLIRQRLKHCTTYSFQVKKNGEADFMLSVLFAIYH